VTKNMRLSGAATISDGDLCGRILVAGLCAGTPYQPPAKRVSPAEGLPGRVVSAAPRAADGHPDLTASGGCVSVAAGPYTVRRMGTLSRTRRSCNVARHGTNPFTSPSIGKGEEPRFQQGRRRSILPLSAARRAATNRSSEDSSDAQ